MTHEQLQKITLEPVGCDDTTRFPMNVTGEQLRFLKEIAEISEDISDSSCQPVIRIKEDAR